MGYKTEKKIPSIILSVFIVLLILVGTIVPAYAAPTQDMMVTDSGEMLSDREEQEVSEMLYSINRQTGIEYLVYTIKSLNGEDIETCANRLFRTAGLGDKEKDNGLLLLISYDDRKFRLEVGYGLEGDIPDTQAANIINTMTPYFKEGNYGDGVKAAVKQTAVILNSSGEYTISEDWAAQAASNDEANQTSSLIAAGLVLGICYLLLGYTFWLNWPETKENFYNLWKSGKFKPFKEKKRQEILTKEAKEAEEREKERKRQEEEERKLIEREQRRAEKEAKEAEEREKEPEIEKYKSFIESLPKGKNKYVRLTVEIDGKQFTGGYEAESIRYCCPHRPDAFIHSNGFRYPDENDRFCEFMNEIGHINSEPVPFSNVTEIAAFQGSKIFWKKEA